MPLPDPNIRNPFTTILKKGYNEGMIPGRSQEARVFYRQKAKEFGEVTPKQLMTSDVTRFRQQVEPGRLYMFYYDPKLKLKLPWYDEFPLIFPLDVYSDRFIGLNMHYLPYPYRAKLMDALYELINNNRYDATTKIQLSYRILKATSNLKYYRPCIKVYLKGHVRSRFVNIAPDQWDIAMFLPGAEQFQKATKYEVWSNSMQQIKYGKNTQWRR